MQRVGTVVGTAQGLVVARVPTDSDGDYPEMGTEVVDESLTSVGEVVEIFGPVDRPYVAVSPSGDVSAATLLDAPIYAR